MNQINQEIMFTKSTKEHYKLLLRTPIPITYETWQELHKKIDILTEHEKTLLKQVQHD